MSNKIVLISGGIEKNSKHSGVLRAVLKDSTQNAQFEIVDASNIPLVNEDLVNDGVFPAELKKCRDAFNGAKGVIFAIP